MADEVKTIKIHGNDYVTVAERVNQMHGDEANWDMEMKVETSFLPSTEMVVCHAVVTCKRGVFHGTSAANPNKAIEKMSPYEVAETSAVGRALGFAGYGVVNGIASADEVNKVEIVHEETEDSEVPRQCLKCNVGQMIYKSGEKAGRAWAGRFCSKCDNKEWINVTN